MIARDCARSASEPKARRNKPFKQMQNDLKGNGRTSAEKQF